MFGSTDTARDLSEDGEGAGRSNRRGSQAKEDTLGTLDAGAVGEDSGRAQLLAAAPAHYDSQGWYIA